MEKRVKEKFLITVLSFSAFTLLVMAIAGFSSAALDVHLADQGVGVKSKSTGELIDNGNLTVEIWDSLENGTKVYNETFEGVIDNGRWSVLLGETDSNPLSLEFGKVYYKDYKINGEDVDFTNSTGQTLERRLFNSPLGDIGGEDINQTTNITAAELNINGNLSVDTNTLFVDSNGNKVGIGTDAPISALDVLGADYIKVGSETDALSGTPEGLHMDFQASDPDVGPAIRWTDGTLANTIGFYIAAGLNFQGDGGNPDFKIRTPTDAGGLGTEVIHLDGNTNGDSWFNTGGNVGIGTNSPGYILDVVPSGADDYLNIQGTSETGIRFDNGDAWITVHDGFGNFNFLSGIDNDNVIQSGSGGSRLEMSSGGAFYLEVYSGSAGTTGSIANNLVVGSGGVTTQNYLDAAGGFRVSGNTGITDAIGADCAFSVKGGIVYSLDICVSDRRLKTNISSYPYGLDELMKLNPVTFNWNEKAGDVLEVNTTKINEGLIAQEVESVIPKWVEEDKDTGYKRVLSSLAYLNLKAIQELKSEKDSEVKKLFEDNDKQDNRIENLEKENEQMKNALCELGREEFC